jgi:hypothetical protein
MKQNYSFLLASLLLIRIGFAPFDDWRLIGERSVAFLSDKDVIKVGGKDWYSRSKSK